ncbi:hypothetical protein Lbir_1119 [Legionella birminghamensis]|uniref:SH2 domain-containing protein n=1 Tax=Legionella birminghamensis TaxID=28083 RepID=A0A378IBS1_9GAMM|nr:hypothetical protein [Legionella birminghamensis]KTC73067.1 hypothetical protein Lbir_1119 [Legionella birminghamensis]STX32356.1 Uncharacterised protein [Legionella birminghamensis]
MESFSQIQELLRQDKQKEDKTSPDNRPLCMVFKQKLTDSPQAPYLDFEDELRNKVDGSWLIRESGQTGMISLSYKLGGRIDHKRFVYIGKKWKVVDYKRIAEFSKKPFEAQTKETMVNELIDSLLKIIFEKLPLTPSGMLLPLETQASAEESYYHSGPYIVLQHKLSPIQKVYDKPLDALANSIEVIKKIRQNLDTQQEMSVVKSLKEYENFSLPPRELLNAALNQAKPYREGTAKLMKDIFAQWLEVNKLGTDLFCPVTLDLFDEPYVLTSGKVVNASAWHGINQHRSECPLTRTPIVHQPEHVKGYRRKLAEALMQFYDMIKEYQLSLKNSDNLVLEDDLEKAEDPAFRY